MESFSLAEKLSGNVEGNGSIKKSVPEYLITEVANLVAEMDDGTCTVNKAFNCKMVTEEILRQNEIRIMKYRREWRCDPYVTDITRDDIHMARRYLNTVEDWDGW